MLAEDNDYALYGVVLFKRVVDDFRAAARLRGWVVRELNPEAQHTAEVGAGGKGAAAAAPLVGCSCVHVRVRVLYAQPADAALLRRPAWLQQLP